MDHHVGLEIMLVLHFLITNITLEHPLCVGHGQVFPEQSLRGKLLVAEVTEEGVAGGVEVVVQGLHAAVLVLALGALEELLLSGLLVSDVSVGVKVELVEILEHLGANMTAVLLVLVETGVLQEQVQVQEQFAAVPHRALVVLLSLVYFDVSLQLRILIEVLLAVLTLVAGVDGQGQLATVRTETLLGVESPHRGPARGLLLLAGQGLVAQRPDLVRGHVLLDVGLLSEASAADDTLVGSLPGVGPDVLGQVEVLVEPLLTITTEQLLLLPFPRLLLVGRVLFLFLWFWR